VAMGVLVATPRALFSSAAVTAMVGRTSASLRRPGHGSLSRAGGGGEAKTGSCGGASLLK
jgi:hypothetical protein